MLIRVIPLFLKIPVLKFSNWITEREVDVYKRQAV